MNTNQSEGQPNEEKEGADKGAGAKGKEQKDKARKPGGKSGTVLGEINDDPGKKGK